MIPNLFAGKTMRDTVRVWTCGCASGDEAYSLAMLLSEYAARLSEPPKFQVFATDVDEEVIADAREGSFPETIAADVSAERLKRFFTKEDNRYRIKKDLRECILFAPHNVLRDPPFSRLDLVTCRNVLIYLNREAQQRVLEIFHFSLAFNGFLFLGSSESAESAAHLFRAVDKKQRIYHRIASNQARGYSTPRLPVVGRWESGSAANRRRRPRRDDVVFSPCEVHHKLLERFATPSVLVNQDFETVYMSESVGRYLRFAGGEPSRSLLKTVHPEILPDLRAALYSPQRGKSVETPNIRVQLEGEETIINLSVRAVGVEDGDRDFLLVIFDEAGRENNVSNGAETEGDAAKKAARLSSKDEAAESVVVRLEEDLQRTRENLRAMTEQHEVTVEELKSSNEELQAVNEELRSALKEIETSKEELHSVNEELIAVNAELKEKMDATVRTNSSRGRDSRLFD